MKRLGAKLIASVVIALLWPFVVVGAVALVTALLFEASWEVWR